ncbi:histidine kinase [Leptospira perolatii]|uniref:histidine kinase n=1 Tax=Leptospira perolatii TaxID=2023191 RepID=A0A2M9ZIW9_9LEPT|nr:ATP-binding protein [Leptospira perolatii]PJZ68614.1 histidine kinase [Leptospira perolatii]PJZ71961.1 histidine kinase [Leptospira perolatii]
MSSGKGGFSFLDFKILNIESRILLPFFLGCLLLVLLLGLLLFYFQMKNTETTAIRNVKVITEQLLALRVYYSDNIVKKALKEKTEVTYKYKEVPKSIPLPATMVKEFGIHLTNQFEGIRVELFSRYPFPNRGKKGGLDQFEKSALSSLEKTPEKPYYVFEEIDSVPYIRYALADRMQPSCVGCHNTHPESPKRDWKVGDVRGILEVSMPVNKTESGADLILFFTIAILIGLGTIFIVNLTRSKQTEAMILDLNANLELKVESRTEELNKSNAELLRAIHSLEKLMNDLTKAQSQLLLSEKLAAIGQLAAGMTHELNTPLGAISSSNRAILEIINKEVREIPNYLSNLNEVEFNWFKVLLEESQSDLSNNDILPNRKRKADLTRFLSDSGVENPMIVAGMILDIGADRISNQLIELFQSEKCLDILKAVLCFVTINRLSKVISVATGKATHVVGALKNYLHPGDKSKEEDMSEIDLISEMETILVLYQYKIKHGVEIIKNYETEERCIGNANKLNQVWINLINNGLQSMDYKGKIEIYIQKREDWIVVSFIDSGPGIPIDIQAHIFDAFFTTKKHGEGVGLGLDICKKIIESIGGRIEFESLPGRTRFSVWLRPAGIIKKSE